MNSSDVDLRAEFEELLVALRQHKGVLRIVDPRAFADKLESALAAVVQGGWDAETVKRQVADFNALCDAARRYRERAEAAEAEIAALQAERVQLREALRDTAHTLPDGEPCWCPVVADMGDQHDDYCVTFRALLRNSGLSEG